MFARGQHVLLAPVCHPFASCRGKLRVKVSGCHLGTQITRWQLVQVPRLQIHIKVLRMHPCCRCCCRVAVAAAACTPLRVQVPDLQSQIPFCCRHIRGCCGGLRSWEIAAAAGRRTACDRGPYCSGLDRGVRRAAGNGARGAAGAALQAPHAQGSPAGRQWGGAVAFAQLAVRALCFVK